MRIKSYQAESMPDVMRLVREELGDEAVIVATTKDGEGQVRVTAALERPDPEPDPERDPPSTTAEDTIATGSVGPVADHIAATLAYHGVITSLADRLVGRAATVGSDDPNIALAVALDETFRFAPIPSRDASSPVMLVGPPGTGKTLTTAKLAARLVLRGLTSTIVNADVSRAGAAEQLAALTAILGVRLDTVDAPGDLARAVSDSGESHAVFIDTFAVNPFDKAEMDRLGEYISAIGADPVVVLGGGLDAPEAAEIAESFAGLGAKRMITTRIDQTRRLGSLLTTAHAGGLAIADAGVTPHVAHGLTALNPVSLARLLCRDPDANIPDTAQQEVSQ